MKLRVLLSLLFVMAVAGCKAPQKPAITDDTIVTSQVNGITLTHRHAVTPPAEFTQVNEPYRAMYPASLMSRPDYGGKVIRTLEQELGFSLFIRQSRGIMLTSRGRRVYE